MMNNRRNYFLALGIVITIFGIDMLLLLNSRHTVPHANTIPADSTFATIATVEGDISEQSLPSVYNLPPDINASQTIRLRRFLYQFSTDHSLSSLADGHYREGSLHVSSGTASILIDIPSVKQTLVITTRSDNTLDIRCGSPIDQKEASWACSNDSLGESE